MTKKGIDLSAALKRTPTTPAAPPPSHLATTAADRMQAAQAVLRAGGALADSAPGFHMETGRPPLAPEAPWGTGAEQEVELAALHDNPYGARSCYPEQLVAARAASIKLEGQLEPIKVSLHPERPGEYIVIDGGCRKRSLGLLGRKARISIRPEVLSPLELHRLSRIYNKERDDGSALDDALVWRRMLDDKVVADQDALAAQVAVSKGQISKTLALLKLPGIVRERIETNPGPVTSSFGYQIYLFWAAVEKREDGEQLTLDIVSKVQDDELNCNDIDRLRKKLEAGKERKQRESSRQYHLHAGNDSVGTLKEWDSGKVVLEVLLPDPAMRDQLIADLKRRFVSTDAP